MRLVGYLKRNILLRTVKWMYSNSWVTFSFACGLINYIKTNNFSFFLSLFHSRFINKPSGMCRRPHSQYSFTTSVLVWALYFRSSTSPELEEENLVYRKIQGSDSWFQAFTVFYMLYAFFWVITRRLEFICRRFRTLCLFHLHSVHIYLPMKMEQTECSETSAYELQTPCNYPKRKHTRKWLSSEEVTAFCCLLDSDTM